MEKKVFRSRISVVMTGFIAAIFVWVIALLFRHGGYVAAFIVTGMPFLLVATLFTGMRYVIVNDKLYMQMWGIPNFTIKITDILSVRRSYNPLSSPAASLKRLCLRLNKNSRWPHYCLISPVREQEFLDALKSINPDIDIQVSEKHGKWRVWDWDI